MQDIQAVRFTNLLDDLYIFLNQLYVFSKFFYLLLNYEEVFLYNRYKYR